MRFLIDNQLPPALARYLSSLGHEAQHVRDVSLESSSDADIWAYAMERGLVIISKDEDFQHLANSSREALPQVVWVRLLNCRKLALLAAFDSILPALNAALEAGERIVEIR